MDTKDSSTKKRWLVRTRSNQILGPISKEKVLELLSNKMLNPLDEVCSGNGYWFFFREGPLVQRFIYGDELQPFNPISESKDVLVVDVDFEKTQKMRAESVTNEKQHHASEESDITTITSVSAINEINAVPLNSFDALNIPEKDLHYPPAQDLEYPIGVTANSKMDSEAKPATEQKKEQENATTIRAAAVNPVMKKKTVIKSENNNNDKGMRPRNDRYLFVVFVILAVFLLGTIYFGKNILTSLGLFR
ncbi:MAG: hypothetical protein HQK53_04645 [Oligoflexia bacterium]|nr:hypothetical protein [Oligoflexia bacterium]